MKACRTSSPENVNDLARETLRGVCRAPAVWEVYQHVRGWMEEERRSSVKVASVDGIEEAVVYAVLGALEEQGERPLFERRVGPRGLPEAYRLHTNASVGHYLADRRLVVMGSGIEKGEFVSVREIYAWLNAPLKGKS